MLKAWWNGRQQVEIFSLGSSGDGVQSGYSIGILNGLNTRPMTLSASPLAHSSVRTLSSIPLSGSKRMRYVKVGRQQ